MSLLFLRVWQRNARVWGKHIQASLIGNLGQPFLFLIAMGYGLGREIPNINGLTYLQFIAPGLVASATMYSAAFEATFGSYTRLSTQRTFEAILMTPVSAYDLGLGAVVWGATKGLLSGIIMVAALPLFGVIPSLWTLAIPVLLFLEGMIFAAFGLVMTALASNYEFFNYFTSLVLTPLFLFSGIFFPLDALHPAASLFVRLLPLSHVVDINRALCYGRLHSDLLLEIAVVLLYSAVMTALAMALLRRRLIK